MPERLTWQEIEKSYDQEWVELIDFDWPEEEANPKAGKVRVHAASRKEFYELASQNPPKDSAFIFVGKVARPKGVYLSANLKRIVSKNA